MNSSTNSAMVINSLGAGGVTEAAHQLLKRMPVAGGQRRLYVLKKASQESSTDRLQSLADDGIAVTFGAGHRGKIASIAHLANWLDEQRISLLHTHSFRPNLYGRLAGAIRRGYGLRLVAHYHNQYDDKWPDGSDALLLEQQLANQTDAFIAVSEAVRVHVAAALKLNPSTIRVIENGVDLALMSSGQRNVVRQEFGLAQDHTAIGLVGRICEQKGQEDLVSAARRLRTEHPNFRYLLIGAEEDRELHCRLRHDVKTAGLDGIIHFTGFRKDMPDIYAALDVLAAPSRWEGFGLMLVEAMASGVPIVASDVGAIPDVLKHGRSGLLIAPRDPVGLSGAILRLARDADLRDTLIAAGRRRASSFSWDRSAHLIADLHEKLMGHGSASPLAKVDAL